MTSQIDSRVVLDVPGAENLLGRGDMLFMAPDASKLERLQGAFLDDAETNRIVRYWQNFHSLETYIQEQEGKGPGRNESEQSPLFTPDSLSSPIEEREVPAGEGTLPKSEGESLQLLEQDDGQSPLHDHTQDGEGRDELFDEAVQVVSEAGRGSVTILQRKLRVGYNRANRLVEQLEAAGILGPDRGRSQGREVYLKTAEESEKERREERGEEIPSPLTASPPSDHDNGIVNGRAGGSGSVDNGEAGLPPPPEKDDAPPRIWM